MSNKIRNTVDWDTIIEFEALRTEQLAMIAENSQRVCHDESIAYGDTAFFELAKKFRALKGDING